MEEDTKQRKNKDNCRTTPVFGRCGKRELVMRVGIGQLPIVDDNGWTSLCQRHMLFLNYLCAVS